MTDDLVLLIDFGSTYTKVLAIDLSREEVVGRAQAPTTVGTSIVEGVQAAFDRLTIRGEPAGLARIDAARKLASSSAAGGLAIVAVGLVPELTVEAARKAALGAGAKVIGCHAYELDDDALDAIEGSGCDLILLAGGIDGGNKNAILHNARMLASRSFDVPIVYTGNRAAARAATDVLAASGKSVTVCANVLPDLDRMEVEPARTAIRELFMRNIVQAKGLDGAQALVGDILMPTPVATLRAATLLANGHEAEAGLGELMVVEIGGATTNVHSVAGGKPADPKTLMRGLADPVEMRTVEGDLGIRYNARTILELLGGPAVMSNVPPDTRIDTQALEAGVMLRSGEVSFVPEAASDIAIDAALARSAAANAVERHAGSIREAWSVDGPVRLQTGKDLTNLGTVIGTGGVFAFNPHARHILSAACANAAAPFALKPRAPRFLLDRDYLLYGIGLLAGIAPAAALRIAKRHLVEP